MMLFPAFVLGFAGSLHCVGMCGPIAMAVPVGKGTKLQQGFAFSLYQFGRISAYAILGFLFGVLGFGLNMAGFQQGLSLTVGVLMLLFIWFPKLSGKVGLSHGLAKYQSRVTRFMAARLKSNRLSALLGLGFFNGLLPCGLVYVALAGSVATYDPFYGALFMAAFGFGTAPALFLVGFTGRQISVSLRSQFRKVAPLIATVFAVLFILRGLGMGIPFLSPELGTTITNTETCAP